jgi:hypothetical protein
MGVTEITSQEPQKQHDGRELKPELISDDRGNSFTNSRPPRGSQLHPLRFCAPERVLLLRTLLCILNCRSEQMMVF